MAFRAKFVSALSASLMLAMPVGAQEQAAPKDTPNLPSIVVSEVQTRHVVDRVMATGAVKAVEEIYVAPLVDGLSIKTLNADIGDRVEAGFTLATLNQDTLVLQKSQFRANLAKANASLAQYQAQLAEAQANADEAVRVSQRSERLAASGVTSTAQRDQDKASATAAQARARSAEELISVAKADIEVVDAQMSDVDLRLARTDVKAPVSGIVSARSARIGAIASGSGNPLFTIIRDGAIEMKADIVETDMPKLELGQKAKVTLADGKTEVDGEIRIISPIVESNTRLGTVYIALLNPDKARVGMYARAQIIIAEKDALVLPLSAVTRTRDGMVARKVDGDVAHVARIETGIEDGGFIEVIKGLNQGDRVITKAGAFVRDGDRIKPVSAGAETVSN